jgi:ketol-acid reductoisomerase
MITKLEFNTEDEWNKVMKFISYIYDHSFRNEYACFIINHEVKTVVDFLQQPGMLRESIKCAFDIRCEVIEIETLMNDITSEEVDFISQ